MTANATATVHPDPKQERITLEDLQRITLVEGAGSRDNGLCVMTAAAWLAGRNHTDAPPCVSPVIRALLIPINDRCTEEERQRLKEVALVVLDTAPETMGVKRSRSFACADWAVRTVAPLALEAAGKPELALVLRGLGEVVDEASALLARDKTREVQKAAAAGAAYAAYAADAAAAAAYAAAADDDDAAAYAAYAADAAADAAAAYAAARKKMWAKIMDSLVPLVKRLASMNKKGAGE